MGSDARDDFFRLAALLADLDRLLNPLPHGPVGGFGIGPPIPPPLPPVAGPSSDGGPHGARQSSSTLGAAPSAPRLANAPPAPLRAPRCNAPPRTAHEEQPRPPHARASAPDARRRSRIGCHRPRSRARRVLPRVPTRRAHRPRQRPVSRSPRLRPRRRHSRAPPNHEQPASIPPPPVLVGSPRSRHRPRRAKRARRQSRARRALRRRWCRPLAREERSPRRRSRARRPRRVQSRPPSSTCGSGASRPPRAGGHPAEGAPVLLRGSPRSLDRRRLRRRASAAPSTTHIAPPQQRRRSTSCRHHAGRAPQHDGARPASRSRELPHPCRPGSPYPGRDPRPRARRIGARASAPSEPADRHAVASGLPLPSTPPRLPPVSPPHRPRDPKRSLLDPDLPPPSSQPPPATPDADTAPFAAIPDTEAPTSPARPPRRWWGPRRQLVALDPDELARAEPGVHRRYQDRARWRIR